MVHKQLDSERSEPDVPPGHGDFRGPLLSLTAWSVVDTH